MKKYSFILLVLILSCDKKYVDCERDLEFKNGLTYFKGKLYSGDCSTFHSNDSLKSTQRYIKGLDHGEWVYYHDNGNMETYAKFDNGKREGEWLYFFNNSNLRQVSFYKNGLRDSLWKNFNVNSKLIWEKKFLNDTLIEQTNYSNY